MTPGRLAGLAALAALLVVAPRPAASTGPETLAFKTVAGVYRLTFDPATLPEAEMQGLALLSPYLAGAAGLLLAPRVELCLADDPVYLDCDTRRPGARHFAWNARMNLAKGALALRRLGALRHPAELGPVVAYLTRSLAFSLWLEETRLDFYLSWDSDVLRRRYEDVDPAAACGAVLDEVTSASREAKHHLAEYRWHNCVNDVFRARLGEYPLHAWQAFLAAHGIGEDLPDPFAAPTR